MTRPAASPIVALGAGLALLVLTPAAPAPAQEERHTPPQRRLAAPARAHGLAGAGFGSVRATVRFDERANRYRVRVSRVGVGLPPAHRARGRRGFPFFHGSFVHARHPGVRLFSPYSVRGQNPEAWWSGLGLFESGAARDDGGRGLGDPTPPGADGPREARADAVPWDLILRLAREVDGGGG